MSEKKTEAPDNGPCPPLEDVSEAELADTVLSEESAADYDVDETNEESK